MPSFLDAARDLEIVVDLKGQCEFSEVTRVSGLPPDIVLYSQLTNQIVLLERTVPWSQELRRITPPS